MPKNILIFQTGLGKLVDYVLINASQISTKCIGQ